MYTARKSATVQIRRWGIASALCAERWLVWACRPASILAILGLPRGTPLWACSIVLRSGWRWFDHPPGRRGTPEGRWTRRSSRFSSWSSRGDPGSWAQSIACSIATRGVIWRCLVSPCIPPWWDSLVVVCVSWGATQLSSFPVGEKEMENGRVNIYLDGKTKLFEIMAQWVLKRSAFFKWRGIQGYKSGVECPRVRHSVDIMVIFWNCEFLVIHSMKQINFDWNFFEKYTIFHSS